MDDLPLLLFGSALGTGLVFGYVIQRGGFCLTRALSNTLLMRDATILRAYALALLVAMVGVEVLEALSLVDIPLRPLHWLSNIVGGLLFGVGMILSGGCSGSTWYRVGEGAVGAWVVLLGFAIGAIWLLNHLTSKQIFLIAGRSVLIEREVRLSDFTLNDSAFDRERSAARAS